jgi:hypothetical protein
MIDILHISCSVPIDDYGSFGVFLRHYRRLPANEFRVRPVSNPAYLDNIPAGEFPDRIPLPSRQPWWPPVQPLGIVMPWLYRLRFRLLARQLDRHIDPTRTNIVVTHLWDFYSFFAAYYAHSRGFPLITFIHDNLITWTESPKERKHVLYWSRFALKNSFRVFTASRELADAFSEIVPMRYDVLPPLPTAEATRTRTVRLSSPGVVYAFAGKRLPGIDPLLKNLTATLAIRHDRLLIVGDPSAFGDALSAEYPSVVTIQKKFGTSAEAMQHLAEVADRLIVAYPPAIETEHTSWSSLRTSFPSRLVEYAHLRLPILVFCEPESALASWCVRHQYPHVAHETTPSAVEGVLASLADAGPIGHAIDFWTQVARDEFSPESIQASFVKSLRDAATGSS